MNHSHRDISEILKDMDTILLYHKKLNNKAMKMCQQSGYNGFKRIHRYNARCFFDWHLALENMAFDIHEIALDVESVPINYRANNLIDHLAVWGSELEKALQKLAALNNEYCEIAGVGNAIVEAAMCKLAKNHEKAKRWHKRFVETNSAHDMHDLDDHLHAKYKKKEMREQKYKSWHK